jgi:hypothetical protein
MSGTLAIILSSDGLQIPLTGNIRVPNGNGKELIQPQRLEKPSGLIL